MTRNYSMPRFIVLLALLASSLPLPLFAASCSFITPDGSTLVNFSTVMSLQTTPADGQGQIIFTCTQDGLDPRPVSYEMSIDTGNSSTFTPRRLMHSSGATLDYNLYSDRQRRKILGDGSAGTETVSGRCRIVCTPLIVYGRIPTNQWGPAGQYSDTVIVTLEFN
jgi:spore coat protein U-like protein